jgi:hypothetical protein
VGTFFFFPGMLIRRLQFSVQKRESAAGGCGRSGAKPVRLAGGGRESGKEGKGEGFYPGKKPRLDKTALFFYKSNFIFLKKAADGLRIVEEAFVPAGEPPGGGRALHVSCFTFLLRSRAFSQGNFLCRENAPALAKSVFAGAREIVAGGSRTQALCFARRQATISKRICIKALVTTLPRQAGAEKGSRA